MPRTRIPGKQWFDDRKRDRVEEEHALISAETEAYWEKELREWSTKSGVYWDLYHGDLLRDYSACESSVRHLMFFHKV